MEVIDRYDGRPFPSWLSVGRRWIAGRIRRGQTSSLEAVYCAELVATTYQAMGILPDKRPASFYDPGAFWSGDQHRAGRAVRPRRRDPGHTLTVVGSTRDRATWPRAAGSPHSAARG